MSIHILIENALISTSPKCPRTHAWHCGTRIKGISALMDVMGFIVVPVYLFMAPLLRCWAY